MCHVSCQVLECGFEFFFQNFNFSCIIFCTQSSRLAVSFKVGKKPKLHSLNVEVSWFENSSCFCLPPAFLVVKCVNSLGKHECTSNLKAQKVCDTSLVLKKLLWVRGPKKCDTCCRYRLWAVNCASIIANFRVNI
jgi:hypothetical protein